jgi:DNA gyrase/topoisomerase IV subunit A
VRLPNGKLKRFATTEQLIEEWVRLRLEFYEERRLNKIDRLQNDQLPWLRVKLNFIEWWNKNASELVRLPKKDLEASISQHITSDSGYIARLLAIRISNLGIDEIDDLKKDIEKIEKEIQSLENTTNKKMMTQELKEMKL